MNSRKLIEKALKLVLVGRSAKDVKIKDEVLDGLWELLMNLKYEIENYVPISPN